MHYFKKTCILRQLKQGFSGDGKPLSGLIKVEQYGKNLAAEISIINFAPLTAGDYYCLLADANGKVEKLPLRGKCYFNLISDLEIDKGFCGVICFIHGDVLAVAYGVNGSQTYDFAKIVSAAFPFEKKRNTSPDVPEDTPPPQAEKESAQSQSQSVPAPPVPQPVPVYDDERVASENYYEQERNDESDVSEKSLKNVPFKDGSQKQETDAGSDLAANDDDESVRHAFTTSGRGYYDSVKDEIDTLFTNHPRDDTLKNAFSSSEWVRVKGEEDNPQYLVGVVYEDLSPKYVCYALAANGANEPPEEIAQACVFVPTSAFNEQTGFFVIFQSASTGECIHPKRG